MSTFWVTVLAGTAAFCLYTSVYAFRKSFSAATFEGIYFLGIPYKVWLVTSQVAGYAISKFAGIRVMAELRRNQRARGILVSVTVAGAAWVLFAIVPPPWNIAFLLLNGFPLGLTWGLVFSYLEGRRTTDALGALLAVSFIFSSGLCKTVGSYLLEFGASEFWMPLAASGMFVIPLLLSLWTLEQMPPPNDADIEARSLREPMSSHSRKAFVQTFLPGLIIIIVLYTILTAFRDFRDNFASNIWAALGIQSSAIFTSTEIPTTVVCLLLVGSLVFIRNNQTAFRILHIYILIGSVLTGLSSILFAQSLIGPDTWMTLIGMGLYLGYIPFNCSFFDRMIGLFRISGTTGFIMYVADSFGYLGSTAVLIAKQFFQPNLSWVHFTIQSSYLLSGAGILLSISSYLYFQQKQKEVGLSQGGK